MSLTQSNPMMLHASHWLADAGRVLMIGSPGIELIRQLLDRGMDCWLADSRMGVLETLQQMFPALPTRLVRWDCLNPAEFAGTRTLLLANPLPTGADPDRLIVQCATMADRLVIVPANTAESGASITPDLFRHSLEQPHWQVESIPSEFAPAQPDLFVPQPEPAASQLYAATPAPVTAPSSSLAWAAVGSAPGTLRHGTEASASILIAHRTSPLDRPAPGRLSFTMDDPLLWCTRSQTQSFGVPMKTVTWGYEWIRRHMEQLGLTGKRVVDLGSGQSNPLIDWYAQRADHSILIDLINPAHPLPRTQTIVSDLEMPLPLADGSCDLAVSVSVLEHLSPAGRLLQMREIGRVLKPGGHALITVSNLFHLDDHALQVLASEPWLNTRGNQISAPLDVAAMVHASSQLEPAGPIRCHQFPGFEGYDPAAIISQPDVLVMNVASCNWATFLPRTDALAIPWAEVGLHLRRKLD